MLEYCFIKGVNSDIRRYLITSGTEMQYKSTKENLEYGKIYYTVPIISGWGCNFLAIKGIEKE